MLKLPLKFRQQKEKPSDPETNSTAEGKKVVVKVENVRKTYANGFEGLKGISDRAFWFREVNVVEIALWCRASE
jgi:hypothetical protein